MIQELNHPTLGQIRVPGPAVQYSVTKLVEPTAPPMLGQHTDQVLRDLLGYSEKSLLKLRQQKVIQ